MSFYVYKWLCSEKVQLYHQQIDIPTPNQKATHKSFKEITLHFDGK